MMSALLDAIEAVLREREASGVWTDADEALLGQWRAARGTNGKGKWAWWIKTPDDDLFQLHFRSRAEAIDAGRSEYPGGSFDLIEARCWADDINVEEGRFANSRNYERVLPDGCIAAA